MSHVLVYFRRYGVEGVEELELCADGLQFNKGSGANGGSVPSAWKRENLI